MGGTPSSELDIPLPPVLTLLEPFGFVARARAWSVLEQAWAATNASGSRHLVLVGGEAGAGKTRLLTEFSRAIHARDGIVLYGACAEQPAMPYQPLADALDHLAGALHEAGCAELVADQAPELARLAPRMGPVAPPARAGGADPDAERFRLYSAVTEALATIARRRPVLLVLDDLHWSGREALALLGHLTRGAGPGPVCIVAAYRSTPADVGDALRDALPELRHQPGATRVVLGGFDEQEVRRFVEAAAGHRLHVGLERVVETLAGETAGNAFLLGELWRHLVETGHLVRPQARWRIGRPLADLVSPEGVREVVEARLGRLPAETRPVLAVAAVLGARFGLGVLVAASGRDARAVVAALDPALRAGLVEEGGPDEYHFTHALVRRSVYDGLSVAERRGHHLRIAETLERTGDAARVGDIAHHLASAVPLAEPARVVAMARRAASAALAAVAYDDAARRLEAVLSVAGPDRDRCELLLELADAHMRAGDVPSAQARCREAGDLARRLDEPALAIAAALAHDEANWRGALPGEAAAQLLAQALPLARDDGTRLRLQAARGRALAFTDRGEEARAVSEQALARARELGDREALRTAFTAVLFVPWTPESLAGQIAAAREFVVFARREANAEWELWALSKLVYGLITAGALDEARALAARHSELATRLGQPLFRVLDLQLHGLLATGEGRFDEAEAMAEEADELSRFLSGDDAAGGYGVQLFGIRREQGRLGEARPMVEAVARLGEEGSTWRPALAVLYAELGMGDEAAAEVGHLVAGDLRAVARDALWCASLSYLAEAAAGTGDAGAAEIVHRALLPYRGLVVHVGTFLGAYGAVDRYLGMLAARLGHPDDAEGCFEAALRTESRAGMPVWTARTQLAYGAFLSGRGGPDTRERGRSLLLAARETADRLGMESVAAAARRALAVAGGGREPSAAPPDDTGLTVRELAVLRLLAEGLTNVQIGERLHISPHTAANHVRAILAKSGCANRTQAAAWAMRRGLVSG